MLPLALAAAHCRRRADEAADAPGAEHVVVPRGRLPSVVAEDAHALLEAAEPAAGDGRDTLIARAAGRAVVVRARAAGRVVGVVAAAADVVGRARVVAAVVHAHAAEFVRPEGARVVAVVVIFVIFRVRAGGASVLCPPAVSAGENVLDTLIRMELRGLSSPGSCESPAIQILNLSDISILR